MGETTEEVTELPAIDGTFEPTEEHFDLTDAEAALGHVIYREIDDLDDESNGLIGNKGENG